MCCSECTNHIYITGMPSHAKLVTEANWKFKLQTRLNQLIRKKTRSPSSTDKFGQLCKSVIEVCESTNTTFKRALASQLQNNKDESRRLLCQFFEAPDNLKLKILQQVVNPPSEQKKDLDSRQQYMAKKTATKPLSKCPRCLKKSLVERTFAGAAAGTAGGKAVQRYKSECLQCGYSEEL